MNLFKTSFDRSIFLSKGFYFFYFAAAASLMPFLVLYFEEIGLVGRQIGVLAGIPPLVTLFASSFWGGLADATKQHRRILAIAIVGTMIMAIIYSTVHTFVGLIPVVIIFAFFLGPIIPLTDNSVLELLGEQTDRYGKVRLWGAAGWGLVAPLAGRLVEQFGLTFSFYGYVILMVGGLVITLSLPISESRIGGRFWEGLGRLVRDRRWVFFLITIWVGGMGMAVVHNFLFLYLNDLGASRTLMGWSLTVATVSEMAVFFFSDRLLARWGTRRLLIIGLGANLIRLLAYSLVDNPYLVLVIQLMHGLSFSAMWVAGVAYANKIAPKGLGATSQGLLNGVFFGFGSASGALLGGFLYEQAGPFVMYRWASVWVLIGLLLFIFIGQKQTEPTSVSVKS